MKWFLNLNTSAKLSLGFGATMVLTCLVGYVGYAGAAKLNSVQNSLATETLPSTRLAGQISTSTKESRLVLMRIMMAMTPEELQQNKKKRQEVDAELNQSMDEYAKTVSSSETRKAYEAVKTAWSETARISDEVVGVADSGDTTAAMAMLDGKYDKKYNGALTPALDNLLKTNLDDASRMSHLALATYAGATRSIIGITLFALALAAFFSKFIGSLISRSLRTLDARLTSLTSKCAAGLKGAIESLERYDLTATPKTVTEPIPITAKDDLNRMAGTFNTLLDMFSSAMQSFRNAQESLAGIVGQLGKGSAFVNTTSDGLTTATEQTSRASTEVAQASERLAVAAGEAAAVMEKLNGAVGLVKSSSEDQHRYVTGADAMLANAAEIAEQVGKSARDVATVAIEGKKKVDDIVASNNRISLQVSQSSENVNHLDEASKQIGAIVQSIEQIAEQTNLLALNAAIEAARAGEHGRGFAVVADEVRKLAEQAGTATKEIASLIDNVRHNVSETVASINSTVPLVEAGTALTREAGESLGEIAAAAGKVADDAVQVVMTGAEVAATIGKIREATTENLRLSEGISSDACRVAGTIQGVAAVSQEAAASAEELSATSEEVSAAASELHAMAAELNTVVHRFRVAGQAALPKAA